MIFKSLFIPFYKFKMSNEPNHSAILSMLDDEEEDGRIN